MLPLLALLGLAHAAQLNLAMRTRSLEVGQTVAVELDLVGASATGAPELPVGRGLRAEFRGQSQEMTVVNFQTTRTVSYTYALTAMAEGDWSVGPVSLVVGGQQLLAAPLTVHVGPRSAVAKADRDASAALSDTDPYLGQVVVYRFRFQHRGQVIDARWTEPSFDGFVKEAVAEVAQNAFDTQDPGGETVNVQTIDLPLVAAGAGARTIGPALLGVQVPGARSGRDHRFDPFANSPFKALSNVTSETLTAPAIPVTIQALPTEGRPADFSGLVGHFALTVTPSATTVKTGDAVTLEIAVQGDGTLSGFHLPALPASADFSAYDDAPAIEASVMDGKFVSKGVFRRAIVPGAAGTLTVPGLRIPTFDPQTGSYVVLSSEPIALTVLPGEAGTGQVTSYAGAAAQREVAALGDDILPVSGTAKVADRTLAGRLAWTLAPPLVPALVWSALALRGRLRNRRRDPWADLAARLAALPAEPEARLGALEDVFRAAAGLRLGRPPAGLERAGVAALGEEADTLYGDLEAARYGGIPISDLEVRVRAFVERRS